MDRPPGNPHVARLLRGATVDQLLRVREASTRTGMRDLASAAEIELRQRTTIDIEDKLRPYRVNRIV